jgi:hypothetical protein
MVNIFFLVLALSFSYRSFAGLIYFEKTASGETPTDNFSIRVIDNFMADNVSVSFSFDTSCDGTLDSHGLFEKLE